VLDELVFAHFAHIHVAFLRPAEPALVEVDRFGRVAAPQLVPADMLRPVDRKDVAYGSGLPSGGIGFII
jgi:hypothetical protein